MIRICKIGGRLLIFVWALEQPKDSNLYRHDLKYVKDGDCQNVLVPWNTSSDPIIQWRYYHLFRLRELEELVGKVNGNIEIVESGHDRGNYYVVIVKK